MTKEEALELFNKEISDITVDLFESEKNETGANVHDMRQCRAKIEYNIYLVRNKDLSVFDILLCKERIKKQRRHIFYLCSGMSPQQAWRKLQEYDREYEYSKLTPKQIEKLERTMKDD